MELTAEDRSSEPIATVHLEVCLAFDADHEAADGVCRCCGWLLDEHDTARAA